MLFSYRTRRFLARIFPTLLTVLVLLLVAAACWLLWLQRFVVYTPQGAVFDFGLQPPAVSGIIPQKPAQNRVTIEYSDDHVDTPLPPDIGPDDPGDPTDPLPPKQAGIVGYYFDAKAVQEDPEAVRQQLEQLPAGTAVLVRVANFWGYRYYTSEYGTPISQENSAKMDALLEWMSERDLYVIARMPAFRDYFYSVDNTPQGLKKANGYLWQDPDRCYWLNPTNEKVLTRLTQIMRELRNLGFDEVVFDDFTMPDTEEIVFNGDRREAIYAAAETLAAACATESFAVSFLTEDYDFRLPEGNCRLYIENAEPSAVEEILSQLDTADDTTQVVFFCDTFDNRFDGCSVLRPLELVQ